MSEQVQPPASATAAGAALEDSIAELRPLIEKLFTNEQRAEGLVLSQIKALYLKLQHGITATRSDFLSLLDAASRMPRRGE